MSRQAISLHLPNCKAYASLFFGGAFFTQNVEEPGGLSLGAFFSCVSYKGFARVLH